jgi:Rps23 Pro-64 3,4-dihydroxylase Tpa1-like proline 4-hydroxylase
MEAVERLLAYAQSNEHFFKEAEIVGGVIDRTRRISKTVGLGELKSGIIVSFQEVLPVMLETLRAKPFVPTFELELAAHGDGAFFARHFDTLTHRRRIISAVYYFHALPKAFSGGVLRLHSMAASGQEGTYIDIAPDRDTLVFFPSMFPHEVLPIKSQSAEFLHSRFAINCWIREDNASP